MIKVMTYAGESLKDNEISELNNYFAFLPSSFILSIISSQKKCGVEYEPPKTLQKSPTLKRSSFVKIFVLF